MAIKLYYNKNTYQLITIDDGGESIVVGDDGGKEFQFYFGTGTGLGDYVNDVTIPVNYLGRAVIERPDGEVTNELYLTPQSGYFKLIVTDWLSQVEGNLEITTRLKVSDGDGGYITYPFTVATIPVETGVVPGDDTIEDAQYQAILDAVNAIPSGTTPFEQIILYHEDGNAVATYDGVNIRWAYRGISAEMFENLFVEVTANGDIANGDVVQYDSAIGASGKIRAKKAVPAEINVNPKLILGVATNAIPNGTDGTINFFGEINGINTTGYTAGQVVYFASESISAGQFTSTKPTAPNVQVELGIVKVVHANQGVIKIRPCFGMFLSELHDVHVNGHTFVGGETIKYNITTSRYEIFDLDGALADIGILIDDLETFRDTTVPATYETKADASTHKNRTTALENANMVKSIERTGTNLITITYFNDTTSTVITLSELKSFIGNATQSVAGLLSAEDKTHLDGLVALLSSSDGNTVVDTIGEILAIFNNYPEGADLVTALNGKVDKVAGKQLSTNDLTDVLKNNYDVAYTHSQIKISNPHEVKFSELLQKPTTRDGYGITDVYTKPETYTQLEINNLLDNLSAVKGLKSTLLTPTELVNGSNIPTISLTQNGAYIVFTATNTSTGEIDSDTVPVSTIITGKKFVFFDNQETVFTIGETNSTFETSEDITLKINLLYLDSENVQAAGVDFDGSLTTYLENQENVQSAINKLDEELKTTNDNKVDKVAGKGLSSEDYTTTEKNKLSGIAEGAEVNIQSDWTQEVNTADDYIKNKPAIPTKVSDLTNDTGYINTETDPIFTAWDKQTGISITKSQITDLIEATQALSGLMSATDKTRLDTLHALLEENEANTVVDSINEILAIFNNYPEGADLVSALANKVDKNNAITGATKTKITYDSKGLVTAGDDLVATDIPNLDAGKITSGTFGVDRIPSLAPSKITQDANNRFVTDTEKSTWNGKQNALTAGDGISISGNVISADGVLTVETWDISTKTLALSDTNKLFKCSHTDFQTVIIPTNATVVFPIGTMITFLLTSTYPVTFTAASGVTLTSMDGLVELKTQYGMASLIKTDTNTWQLVGALE